MRWGWWARVICRGVCEKWLPRRANQKKISEKGAIKWPLKSKKPRHLEICLVRASTMKMNVPCAESLQQRSGYNLGWHRNNNSSHHFCYQAAGFTLIQLVSGFFSGATIGSFNKCTFNIQFTSGSFANRATLFWSAQGLKAMTRCN